VHRIGRTARAGASGIAISLVANDERLLLRDIQKLTRQTVMAQDRRGDRVLGAELAVERALAPEDHAAPKPQGAGGGQRNRRKYRPGGAPGGAPHGAARDHSAGRSAQGSSRDHAPSRDRGAGRGGQGSSRSAPRPSNAGDQPPKRRKEWQPPI
jgi:ATP-dependent RNA helicase RhlE